MPVFLERGLAALVVAVPTVLILAGLALPFVRRWLDEHVAAKDVEALKAAVKGAYAIVARISAATPTTLDDSLAELLRMADKEFQNARGRPMEKEELEHAANIALSMHADPDHPDLVEHDDKAHDLGHAVRQITATVARIGSGAQASP